MNDDLLLELLAQHRPRHRRFGCVDALFLGLMSAMLLYALAVKGPELLVTYGLVSVETMTRLLNVEAPAATSAPARAPTALPAPPPSRPAPVAPSLQLPDCATVADTTTACVRSVELAPPTATEAPAPVATAEPAAPYESACITPPGARPCWLPADQAWSPPADVPATPIVLVPEATAVPMIFTDSACAAWHPPLALPKGCGNE